MSTNGALRKICAANLTANLPFASLVNEVPILASIASLTLNQAIMASGG